MRNEDKPSAIAEWNMRAIVSAQKLEAKHDPLGDEKVRYLEPPSPGVHFLMVVYLTRKQAGSSRHNLTPRGGALPFFFYSQLLALFELIYTIV